MKRNTKILIFALAALLLAIFANLCLGASAIPLRALLHAIADGSKSSMEARILWFVRLPRIFAAVLAGSALSVSGMLLQSVLNNPLAAPGIIGVNSGAALSALIAASFLPHPAGITPAAAFLGACLTAFGVYALARCTGSSRYTIALAGVAVSSILGAAMDTIVTLVPDAAVNRSFFAIGGFANVGMDQLGFALPFCIIGLLIPLLLSRELDILTLGDDVAASLGLRTELLRAVFLIAAAMLAGAAVSFAGLLGFVGLIAPHMVKLICKGDVHLQIPVCALFGAVLCLLCDLIARTLFMPYELPVGVILSFLGAPFFLYLLLTQRRRNRHSGS